jgi:hypothetical protein
MAHTRFVLDKQCYTYACACTHPRAWANTRRKICNTFCLSTATVVTRMLLKVMLYVHFFNLIVDQPVNKVPIVVSLEVLLQCSREVTILA